MGDDDRRRSAAECGLEQADAFDVEVVGGLVEQYQVRLERERERQRGTLDFTAGSLCGRRLPVESEAVQVLGQARLGAPALALVLDAVEPPAPGEAFAQRCGGWQRRLLLDQRDPKPVGAAQFAVVQRRKAGDYREQRRLPAAVAADEADALALPYRQLGAVEQR